MTRRRAGLALLAACALLAAWSWLAWSRVLPRLGSLLDLVYAEPGEALLHAAHPAALRLDWRMPAGLLLEAWGTFHDPGSVALWAGASYFLSLLLAASLGLLMGGPAAGVLAAAAWQGVLGSFALDPSYLKHLVLSPLLMLPLAAMVRRAGRPGRAADWLVAAALGASLLYRSTLFFLPPLLALYELAGPGRRAPGRGVRSALILGLGPYLFLLPWLAFNWSVYGSLRPFERGPGDMSLALAALGVIPGGEGEAAAVAGLPPGAGSSQVLAWAVGEVAAHPLRYLAGFAGRLLYAARLHPLLFLAGVAALWRSRSKEEARQAALFASYLAGFTCLMAVEADYFYPLWPALIAPAAAWLATALPAPPAALERRAARLAAAVVGAALVFSGSLSLGSGAVMAAYLVRAARRSPSSLAAYDEGLSRAPDDAWLLARRGRELLAAGRRTEALADLARAAIASPAIPGLRLELAWARLEAGDPRPLLEGSFATTPESPRGSVVLEAKLYQAAALLRLRREAEARRRLAEALVVWRGGQYLRGRSSDREEALQARLQARIDARLVRRLPAVFSGKPVEDELAVAEELASLVGSDPALWLEAARSAALAGRTARARAALARVRPLSPPPELAVEARRLAARLDDPLAALMSSRLAADEAAGPPAAGPDAPDQGDPGLILARWRRSGAAAPQSPEAALMLARLLREAGERSGALEQLGAAAPALAARPELLPAAAALYRELGEPAEAERLLADPRGPGRARAAAWLERARLELDAGRTAPALAALARAESLKPTGAELRRAALLYQSAGRCADSLRLLAAAGRRGPVDAGLLTDRAVCEHRLGRDGQAEASLRRALSLEPGSAAAALTLGAVYRGLARERDAAAVYDLALMRVQPQDPLRPLLQRALRETAGR